jgi:hypothetical protein
LSFAFWKSFFLSFFFFALEPIVELNVVQSKSS